MIAALARKDLEAEIRERVMRAMRDAGSGNDSVMAEAAISAIAGFAADAFDEMGEQVDDIGTDEREYGRLLAFEECAGFLRSLAGS